MCWRLGLLLETVISIFAIISSVLYHSLELTEASVLGGTSHHWHIADNIFSSTAFCFVAINFIQYSTTMMSVEMAKIFVICLSVICQTIAPWDFRYTCWPIVISLVGTTLFFIFKRRWPQINTKWGAISGISAIASLIFFTLGLNDENDFLRFYHGMWHLSASTFMYSVLRCAHPEPLVEIRLEAYRKAHFYFLDQLQQLVTSETIDLEMANKINQNVEVVLDRRR